MREYIPVLRKNEIFSGIENEEIEALLSCLGARTKSFNKGEYVLRQGEYSKNITILVKGSLHIQSDDYWGNRSILGHISPGEMFGEAYAVPGSDHLINDVVAVEDSEIIYFDFKRIITSCTSACPFHTRVVHNMFLAISEKNRRLVQKLGFLSKRTTREKLNAYLSEVAKRQNSSDFTIPFNRQQLADYLSVDRSAMSKELCKMRDEGMLEFNKNRFRLL